MQFGLKPAIIYHVRSVDRAKRIWGISTVGSALHSHCRGQEFESPMLHHLSTQILIQYLGTSFLHIKEMHDAETELIGGNRTYFPLEMTLERI